MHPRRVIREAVAAAILSGNTAAADRVWASAEPPISVEATLVGEGPIVLVYTRHDEARDEDYPTDGQGAVKRTAELCIEILAAGALVVDNKLDDIAEQVELIVDGIEIPGQAATEIRFRECEITSTDQFEQPVGAAYLRFDAVYWKPWRVREDPDFFPSLVSVAIRGDLREDIANCEECDECPPGGHL